MPGRKVRDESEARRLLEAVARSGLERAVWARQHGINARSLNAWRLVLARKDRGARQHEEEPSSVEFLELIPTVRDESPLTALAVRVGDVLIDVPADFDDEHLHRLLQVVLAAC